MSDTTGEPYRPDDVKRIVRQILRTGTFSYSAHAAEEMAADDLTTQDCERALRSGVVQPPDFERGTWRYRVVDRATVVVIAFRSPTRLVIVTAWRRPNS